MRLELGHQCEMNFDEVALKVDLKLTAHRNNDKPSGFYYEVIIKREILHMLLLKGPFCFTSQICVISYSSFRFCCAILFKHLARRENPPHIPAQM